jgi:hypothetical protein
MDKKSTFTTVFLKESGQSINQEIVDQSKKSWWWNYRHKDSGGLRLTENGFNFIIENTDVRNYKIDFPKEQKLTPQILIYLDRFIESPYYVNKSSITVFEERAALELYLFSGDIKKMGSVKALSKRLNQELST